MEQVDVIKAKDLWNYLCNDLNYRFFTGIPCLGFKPLYDTMDPELMYYVPAIDERSALGMATGATFSGDKACVLMHITGLDNLRNDIKLNVRYRLPILFLVCEDRMVLTPYDVVKTNKDLTYNMAYFKDVLKKADDYISKYEKSVAVVFPGGGLK